MAKFVNGISSWIETHYEIVSAISRAEDKGISPVVEEVMKTKGTGGLYELAEDLTDEFEYLHKDTEWDGEFFDEIEAFIELKLFKTEEL